MAQEPMSAEQTLEPPALLRESFRLPGTSLRLPRKGKAVVVPLLALVAWELLSRVGAVPQNTLPAPSAIADTLLELARGGDLASHIFATLARIGVGFLIGALAGTILGGITGSSRTAREYLDPTIQALRNIPSMAWVPLFLLWLGIQESSKVALIAVGVFFPVYLNLLGGISAVDRRLVEVGEVFQLGRVALFRRVVLPAALPPYLVGLRSGLGLGWMFVVAAEIMGASRGLGFLMIDGQMTGRAGVIIASIVLFALFGKLTDAVIERAGARLASGYGLTTRG